MFLLQPVNNVKKKYVNPGVRDDATTNLQNYVPRKHWTQSRFQALKVGVCSYTLKQCA
jgi:hypothetical protein